MVQNKGGGHGTIGYQLCKNLKHTHPNLAIVMLQDACNRKKEPFNAYDELTEMGVEIIEEKVEYFLQFPLPDNFFPSLYSSLLLPFLPLSTLRIEHRGIVPYD